MRPEDLYEAMQQIRPEFLEDLMEQKRDKRAHRAFLIAAAVAVLGCVTAVAVTFSLRDTARADIGVKGTPVPEWTEYEIEG